MPLADYQIASFVRSKNIIEPFHGACVSEIYTELPHEEDIVRRVMSYGLSSFGYDARLSANQFEIFRRSPGEIINPKDFDLHARSRHLYPAQLHTNNRTLDNFFILPAHTYALGVTIEKFKIPRNCLVITLGKSTYARLGIIVNVTPLEPEWEGHVTLEITNTSDSDMMIFANEGICQMVFLPGENCEVSYADRKGKYQGQPQEVVHARA
jgi:dCTP deaminase